MSLRQSAIIERGILRPLRNLPRKRKRQSKQAAQTATLYQTQFFERILAKLTNAAMRAYNKTSLRPNQSAIEQPDSGPAAREFALENHSGATSIEVPICQLKPGQTGSVIRLDGESILKQHLLEMGFTKGTEVEFIRSAPLGDPVDLRLRGYRLSLRRSEASAVIVEADATASRPQGRKRS